MVDLVGRDILYTDRLSVDEIEHILEVAEQFAEKISREETLDLLKGKVLASLFFEPSTRTRLSFESAMVRLGGEVISVANAMTTSSSAKGETLFDTGKMIEAYAHIAVIRHPDKGSAEELADGASIPVINGGDGVGQHPTQALLDAYTIKNEKGKLDNLTICLAGDLKNGRTVHSLTYLLSNFNNRLIFVAPLGLEMPSEITADLRAKGVDVQETQELVSGLAESDVAYLTRVQKERFEDPSEYEKLKGSYVLDLPSLRQAKEGITIMHPLPRVGEIAPEVDEYEGAAYFRQAANGVPVRMALIALLTGKC